MCVCATDGWQLDARILGNGHSAIPSGRTIGTATCPSRHHDDACESGIIISSHTNSKAIHKSNSYCTILVLAILQLAHSMH